MRPRSGLPSVMRKSVSDAEPDVAKLRAVLEAVKEKVLIFTGLIPMMTEIFIYQAIMIKH